MKYRTFQRFPRRAIDWIVEHILGWVLLSFLIGAGLFLVFAVSTL